jgi:3-methyladenine DNA glycosylase AlkD
MNKDFIINIRIQLKKGADEKTKKGFQRYFKEKVKCHGVKSATVAKIAKDSFKNLPLNKNQVFSICEELLKSGFCEEAWLAAGFTYGIRRNLEEKDFKIFERWIEKYIDNWAECDTFCNHTMGFFIEKYPQYVEKLKIWTKSKNRWLKRASAVSLIVPARKGKFLKDIFEISDSLLKDKDDLVQKGYGWMLKVSCKFHEKEVFDYVIKNRKDMPRTALRYAIEKMPKELKKLAMEKISC